MTAGLPRFVAAGEALTDLIRVEGEHWISKTGGSTWNVARAVAALGVPSAFAGAISRCCFGDALWQASAEAGLDLRFLQRVERSPLLAIVAQAQPPSYFFIGNDSADLHFDPQALPLAWQDEVAWVHFGGISLARAPLSGRLLDLAAQLHAAGVAISYDPNFRNLMDKTYTPTFERMCRLADVIKVSDDDIAGLMQTRDPTQALQEIRQLNPRAWWLFTEGAKGATLFTPEGGWQARAPTIAVVDAVGAGDASIAGLIASRMLAPGSSAAANLAYAIAAGTAACQQAGANPPALASVQALFEQVKVEQIQSEKC